LALDSGGNAFVTGTLLYNLTNNVWIYAIATLGYSSSGIPLFTNLYIGPGNMGALCSSLAVDASGSVYVAGGAKTSDGTASFVTIKYVIPPIITRHFGQDQQEDLSRGVHGARSPGHGCSHGATAR
jgi:hypothetical protein